MDRRSFLKWLGKGSVTVVVVPATALSLVERYVDKPTPNWLIQCSYSSAPGTWPRLVHEVWTADGKKVTMVDNRWLNGPGEWHTISPLKVPGLHIS